VSIVSYPYPRENLWTFFTTFLAFFKSNFVSDLGITLWPWLLTYDLKLHWHVHVIQRSVSPKFNFLCSGRSRTLARRTVTWATVEIFGRGWSPPLPFLSLHSLSLPFLFLTSSPLPYHIPLSILSSPTHRETRGMDPTAGFAAHKYIQ